jgi:hypothetical protein
MKRNALLVWTVRSQDERPVRTITNAVCIYLPTKMGRCLCKPANVSVLRQEMRIGVEPFDGEPSDVRLGEGGELDPSRSLDPLLDDPLCRQTS